MLKLNFYIISLVYEKVPEDLIKSIIKKYVNLRIFWIKRKAQCGQLVYTELTGVVNSVNYPQNYDNNLNCAYRIENTIPAQVIFYSLPWFQFLPDYNYDNWHEYRRRSMHLGLHVNNFRRRNRHWSHLRKQHPSSGRFLRPGPLCCAVHER